MEILIAGRKGSGKSTAAKILIEIYEKQEPLVITEMASFKDLINCYNDRVRLVLIDTNPIIARSRLSKLEKQSFVIDQIIEEDLLIKHLTNLDQIDIISNNLEVSNLRLKLKRLAKSL